LSATATVAGPPAEAVVDVVVPPLALVLVLEPLEPQPAASPATKAAAPTAIAIMERLGRIR
jgi:hypothetical protein